jgi:amino-acid N-acetyltransferase
MGVPAMKVIRNPSPGEVIALLASCGLPSDDIELSCLQNFYVAKDGARPAGVVGLQLLGEMGLLRSLAVSKSARSHGLGAELVRQAEQHAREHGVKQLYLLTNDATAFFARHGYIELQRCDAPPEVQGTAQFGSSCCSGAALMRKDLEV